MSNGINILGLGQKTADGPRVSTDKHRLAATTAAKMELILLLMFGVVSRGNLLERGYLPPPGAKSAGGSPGAIDVPLETPLESPRNNFPSKSMQGVSQHSDDRTNYGLPSSFETEVGPNNNQNRLIITTSSPLEDIRCDGCIAGNVTPSASSGPKPNSFTNSQSVGTDNIQNMRLPQLNSPASYPQSNNTFKSVSIFAPKSEQSGRYNYKPGAQLIQQSISPGSDAGAGAINEFGHVLSPQNKYQQPGKSIFTPPSADNTFSTVRQGGSKFSSPNLRHDDNSLPSNNNFNEAPNFPSTDSYPTTASREPGNSNTFSHREYSSFGSRMKPSSFEGNSKQRAFSADSNGLGPNESAASRSSSASDSQAVILNYDNVITPEGDFSYSFDTSNGIHADESGSAADGVKAQGSFSYSGHDGQRYTVTYTADENGFRPRGDHLPTPPPVPEAIQRVIEQSARDEAAGKIPDQGFYDENKYGYKNYHQEPGLNKLSKTESAPKQPRPLKQFINSERSPSGSATKSSYYNDIVTDTTPEIRKETGLPENDIVSLSAYPTRPVMNEYSRAPLNIKPNYQENNGIVSNVRNGQKTAVDSNNGISPTTPSKSNIQQSFNKDYRQPTSSYRPEGGFGFNQEMFKPNNKYQTPISSQLEYGGRIQNKEFMLKPMNDHSLMPDITTTRSTLYPNRMQTLQQETETTPYNNAKGQDNRSGFIPNSRNTQYSTLEQGTFQPEINQFFQNPIKGGSNNKQINLVSSGYQYSAPNQRLGLKFNTDTQRFYPVDVLSNNMKPFQAPILEKDESSTTTPKLSSSEDNEDGTISMQSFSKHGRPSPGSFELFNVPGEFDSLTTETPLNREEQDLNGNTGFDDFSPDIKYQSQNHKPIEDHPATLRPSTINRGSFRYNQPSATTSRPSFIKQSMQTIPLVESAQQTSTYPTTEFDRSVFRPFSQEISPTNESTPSDFQQPELFQNTLSIMNPTLSQQNGLQARGNVSPKLFDGTNEFGIHTISQAIPDKMPTYGYIQKKPFTDTTESPFEQVNQQFNTQTTPQSNNIYKPLRKGNYDFMKKVPTSRPHQIQPYESSRPINVEHLVTKFQNRQPIFSIKPFPNNFNQQSTQQPEIYYESTTNNDGTGTTELLHYSTSLPESTSISTGYAYHNPNQSRNGEFGRSEDRQIGIPGNDRITSGSTHPLIESPKQNLQRNEAFLYPTTSENILTEYSTHEPALLEQHSIQSLGNRDHPARGNDPAQSTPENPEDLRHSSESLEGLGTKPTKVKGEEFSPSRLPPRYDSETGYHY